MNARLWPCLLLVGVLAGCGSNVKLDQPLPRVDDRNTTAGSTGTGAGGATTGATAGQVDSQTRGIAPVLAETPAADPLQASDSMLAKRSIFFDYDSFTIRDEFRPIVEAHARFLVATPERRLVLQGNTDERGSREYNLALGQKRAEAVRRALGALGVPDAQVEAVSFGEERPRASGTDEASYAENRRTDLVYQ